jgi:hypothetical protein
MWEPRASLSSLQQCAHVRDRVAIAFQAVRILFGLQFIDGNVYPCQPAHGVLSQMLEEIETDLADGKVARPGLERSGLSGRPFRRSRVRSGLSAGGKEIRTVGPGVREAPTRHMACKELNQAITEFFGRIREEGAAIAALASYRPGSRSSADPRSRISL